MPLPLYEKKEPRTKYIAVAAGKGGVGKSTLTAQLGFALKKLGFKVGLLDGDIYGPSLRKMLPEDKLPFQKEGKIMPALALGLKVLSLAHFRPDEKAAIVRAPIATGIISQFINDANWGDLDYLLIDFPPGTGDIPLTICQKIPLFGAVLITTPQAVSLLDVKKALLSFEEMGVPILGIVENLSYFEASGVKSYPFGKKGGESLSLATGYPLLGEIPIDEEVSKASDLGKSLCDASFHGPAKSAIESIGQALIKEIEILNKNDLALKSFELEWKEM